MLAALLPEPLANCRTLTSQSLVSMSFFQHSRVVHAPLLQRLFVGQIVIQYNRAVDFKMCVLKESFDIFGNMFMHFLAENCSSTQLPVKPELILI